MKNELMIGKKEFIQQTSKCLKLVEEKGQLIITHHGEPCLIVKTIKEKSVRELRGLITKIETAEDINTPVFEGIDKW